MALNGGGFSVKDGHFFLRHFRISIGASVIFRRIKYRGASRQIHGVFHSTGADKSRAAGKRGAGKGAANAGSSVKRGADARFPRGAG